MSAPGWLTGRLIGNFKVEREEIPRSGGKAYIPWDAGQPQAGCLHTTEGSSVGSALAVWKAHLYAPHFTVGEYRIVQHRSLQHQASALRSNNHLFIQIEAVTFTKMELWLPPKATLDPLVALMAWLEEEAGIPLTRPEGWSDDLGGGTWAANNPRRQSRLALTFKGWVGHVEVPDQAPTWHWDPGSFDYTTAFGLAKEDEMALFEDAAHFRRETRGALVGFQDDGKRPKMTPLQIHNALQVMLGINDFHSGRSRPPDPAPRRNGWDHAKAAAGSRVHPG